MKKIIFLFASIIAYSAANAQATHTVNLIIPEVTLISITSAANEVKFIAPSSANAGANMANTQSTVNAILSYSSMMNGGSTKPSRSIYVTSTKTSTNNITGISLTVVGVPPTPTPPTSNGILGVSTGEAVIVAPADGAVKSTGSASSSSPVLISGITSGFTGTATGASITYKSTMEGLTTAQYGALRSGTYSFAVTYTLSDNL